MDPTRQPDRAIADIERAPGEDSASVKAVEEARATPERAKAMCVYWGNAYRHQAEAASASGDQLRANGLFRCAAIEYSAACMESHAKRCRDQIRDSVW